MIDKPRVDYVRDHMQRKYVRGCNMWVCELISNNKEGDLKNWYFAWIKVGYSL